MCKEGADLTTIKVALRQGADRAKHEAESLRQWAAYTANLGLTELSGRLAEAAEHAGEVSHFLRHAVEDLVEMQSHGHTHPHEHGGDVTVTPM
jgi:hypothetical protein